MRLVLSSAKAKRTSRILLPRKCPWTFLIRLKRTSPSDPSPLRLKEEKHESPESEAKKKANQPFDPVAFFRKYWLYFLPIIILMAIPLPEEVEQGQQDPRARRVVPGPGSAAASGRAAPLAGRASGR